MLIRTDFSARACSKHPAFHSCGQSRLGNHCSRTRDSVLSGEGAGSEAALVIALLS